MASIDLILISAKATALEALTAIDRGGSQIALVVDEQQRLLGTLTDGDIRRGLLQGASLQAPVEPLMNRNFRFARSSDDQTAVLEMMRREVLRQIPVLDEEGRIVELLCPGRRPTASPRKCVRAYRVKRQMKGVAWWFCDP